MGYVCSVCGMWVGDNQTHECSNTWKINVWPTGNWWTPTYVYPVHDRVINCRKKDCIYFCPMVIFGADKSDDGYCTNKNLMIDSFGCCRCYVKNVEETAADDQKKEI